jgi:hypothetical protein
MNQFSIEELRTMISFHQSKADSSHNLFNSDLIGLCLIATVNGSAKICTIDKRAKLAIEKIRETFYELSVYHRNERIKLEELLSAETETVGTFKPKH